VLVKDGDELPDMGKQGIQISLVVAVFQTYPLILLIIAPDCVHRQLLSTGEMAIG